MMVNLTVDISHTFAVGEGQWVVHNVCKLQRVPYGGDNVTRAAQQFRLDASIADPGFAFSGNVAMFQVQESLSSNLINTIDSSPNFLRRWGDWVIARNYGRGQHSEQVLNQLLTLNDVDLNNVSQLYTELSPCRTANNCMRLLDNGGYRNGLQVNYSYSHPNEVSYFHDVVLKLLKRNGVGLIP